MPSAISPPRARRPPAERGGDQTRGRRPAARRRGSRAAPMSQPVNRVISTRTPTTISSAGDGHAAAPVTAGRPARRTRGSGARARAAGPRPAGRHEQPQQQVDEDAGAAGDGQGDEADPPQQRVDAAVLGEAAADAAEHLVGRGCGAARGRGRRRPAAGAGGPGGGPAAAGRPGAGREAVRRSWREACRPATPRAPSGNAPIRPWFPYRG